MDEITNKDYWEKVWKDLEPPILVDEAFQNDHVIAEALRQIVPDHKAWPPTKDAFEVGCAPGKWLEFFSRELNYVVHGIDIAPKALELTTQNLQYCGVPLASLLEGDFLHTVVGARFDVVYSLGFVEHFEDLLYVLVKQWVLVKEGGLLIVGVPLFTGLNRLLQRWIDRHLSVKDRLLPFHNLEAMKLRPYETFAREHGGTVVFNQRLGGFEPGLFNAHKIPHKIGRVFFLQLIRALNLVVHSPGYMMIAIRKGVK